MKSLEKSVLLLAVAGLAIVGPAYGSVIDKAGDITTSEVWTADNTYNLTAQVYVMPGATLTIEAGTRVASTPTANGAGALAVCNGARIYVLGTAENPVVMTSTNDDGTWRPTCQEWGNLTIMGDGLISAYNTPSGPRQINDEGSIRTNTKVPDGLNQCPMEGLIAGYTGDSRVLYGGDNDDDNSGSISYLSLRYGGRVVGWADELNGLSLGGIGRGTTIDHIEIMNNVDDGIEIWGGTVNLKYVSIWNIGDDSFDLDQGWRGKAQFGLIVQGYSADAGQGSGVGDNCFETDGAEDADCQPLTTSTVYNFTVIGQREKGDAATAWRDGARMQYRNCVFMNIGEEIVRFDDDDDDHMGYTGAEAFGCLPFYSATAADIWDTPAGTHSTINAAPGAQPGDFNHPDTLYRVQTSGMLAEITDCIFYNCGGDSGDYVTTVGVLNGSPSSLSSNAAKGNLVTTQLPVAAISYGARVFPGTLPIDPVSYLNPCAANDALSNYKAPTDDAFFVPAQHCGAFSENENWLEGWTAAYEYGMTGVKGDVNNDGAVNMNDLADVAENWLADDEG